MPDDLTLANVPPEYRKETNNWTVAFNPKLPRNMDVDMIYSIHHPRCVLTNLLKIPPHSKSVITLQCRMLHSIFLRWSIRSHRL